MHSQVFINPQRIQRRGIKTRQKHIHHDQQINLSILHPQAHILVVILESLSTGIIVRTKRCIIITNCTLQEIT